jgi:hypothetical protein
VPRGGRQWQTRGHEPAPAIETDEDEPIIVTAPSARRSRRVASTAATAVVLPREVEYAYIRADLRRLILIAAGLLVLMLVILVVVERT